MESDSTAAAGSAGAAGSIEFRVFGDTDATVAGSPLQLGGRKSRELLAFLLLHGNETIPPARIIDALWGDDAPLTVDAGLRVTISKLRKALQPVGARDLIETRPAGYVLHVDRTLVDVGRFELLAGAGQRALADGRAAEASVQLQEALMLWRGEPFALISEVDEAVIERRRLAEIKRDVQDDLTDAQLAIGNHRQLIPDLERLVAEHPTRERRVGQLMLALYRSGRQADALDAYRSARTALRDELGLEPGPDLRRLEQAILAHDPALAAPAGPDVPSATGDDGASRRRGMQRRLATAATLMALAVLIGAIAWFVLRPDAHAVTATADGVAVIGQGEHQVTATAPAGRSPIGVALAGGSAWVPNEEDDTVTQVDIRTRRVVRTIGIGFEPTDIAAGNGAVWVVGGYDHVLARIDGDGVIRVRIHFRERIGPLPEGYERGDAGVAVGAGGVWVSHGIELTLFDTGTGAVRRTVKAGGPWGGSVAVGAGSVWVAYNGHLTAAGMVPQAALDVINPTTGKRRARIPLVGRIGDIEVAAGFAWIAIPRADTVWRIDLRRLIVDATMAAGDDPVSIALDGGLWVSNLADATVTLIDPVALSKLDVIPVGHTLAGLAANRGEVWVAVTRP